jgi:hypothetical protein
MTFEFTPMIAISIIILIPIMVSLLLLLMLPEWRMRALGTAYYKIFIMEKGLVLQTIILKIKNQLVYLDPKNGVAWIIPPKDKLITVNKNGLLWFADKRSCVGFTAEDTDYVSIMAEIKKLKNMDSILAKIPLINTFYLTRSKKIDAIYSYETTDSKGNKTYFSGKKGFAAKVKTNPDFAIDAITFFHIATQLITDKIIKNPVSMWEMLERNMPIIIVGIVIIVGLILFSNRGA